MKVSEVKVHLLSAPIEKKLRWKSSLGYAVKRDAVVVQVNTDEGITGFGECSHALSPVSIEKIISSVLAPAIVEKDPFDIEKLLEEMHKGCRMLGDTGAPIIAISGVEIALWDIIGKALQVPIHKLLGSYRDRIPAYAGGLSLGWKPIDQLCEEAVDLVHRGFRFIKLRVGRSVREDLESVKAVREAVGKDISLMVDANGAYSRPIAHKIIEEYEKFDLFWIEEPIHYNDLDGLAELALYTPIPIAAGENAYTTYGFKRLLDKKAADIVQPDCCKCGGLLEAKKIATLAQVYHIPVAPHIIGTAIAMATGLQLLGCIPNGLIAEIDASLKNPLRDEIVTKSIELKEGMAKVPNGPGLGVEVDTSSFTRFPYIEGPCYIK